jgi:ParB family chromosome partitioning protein
MKITLNKIKASPFQVRSSMDGQQLSELKASMDEAGLAVPIKVRPMNNHYEIVYGHRRIGSAKQLGWNEIEAIVEELTDEQAMIQGLAENVQRDDLEPVDEARAFERLQNEFGWSKRKIAKEIGKTEAYVRQRMKLLKLSLADQKLIDKPGSGPHGVPKGKVSAWHVDEADKADPGNAKITSQIIHKAAEEDLTVTQTRKVAKSVKAAPTEKAKQRILDEPYNPQVWHDPEFIEERAKKKGAHDPIYRTKKLTDQEWKEAPEVIAIIENLKDMEGTIKTFNQTAEAGKLSPEAYSFLARKARRVADQLIDFAEMLEA